MGRWVGRDVPGYIRTRVCVSKEGYIYKEFFYWVRKGLRKRKKSKRWIRKKGGRKRRKKRKRKRRRRRRKGNFIGRCNVQCQRCSRCIRNYVPTYSETTREKKVYRKKKRREKK